MAAEYVAQRGNSEIILCERGIRTFETATRNTLDLGGMVVAQEESHLPVIVDPSHAMGVRELVAPMALAALAAGADAVAAVGALLAAPRLIARRTAELLRGLQN
jgi:3-deoxy-7-phosphoheptulonate synthase